MLTRKLLNFGKVFKYIEMVSREELINIQTKRVIFYKY